LSRPRTPIDQLSIAGDWEDRFLLTNAAAQFKARARRKTGKATPDQDDAPETDESHLFRELAAERRRSRDAAVRMRREVGFVHRGGNVGGNPKYRRAPFVFQGLVSDEAAILKLFVTKTPCARHLYTGATKDIVEGTDSKLLALDSAYVTTTQRMCGVLRVEIDACLGSWATIPEMCAKAGVPLPNIAVGYADASGQVRNPHLLWLLENSVSFTSQARPAPRHLFTAALRGLTAALVPHGADPGGLSNARRMKNPLSPLWNHAVFVGTPYALADFREHANAPMIAALQAPANRTQRRPAQDHADAEIAIQSNQVFRILATWARQEVADFRDAGLRERFHAAVEDEAYRLCRGLNGDSRRAEQAIKRTAQSVARWTWEKYTPKPRLTAAEVREHQAAAGRATATRHRATTDAVLLGAIMTLARQNAGVITKSDLMDETGLSESTIRRRWPMVTSFLAKGACAEAETAAAVKRSPDDKKSPAGEPSDTTTLVPPAHPSSLTSSQKAIIPRNKTASAEPATPTLAVQLDTGLSARIYPAVMLRYTDVYEIPAQPELESLSTLPEPVLSGSGRFLSELSEPIEAPARPPAAFPWNRSLSVELDHAPTMPNLPAEMLIGRNILVENVDGEAVGPFTDYCRSLLKTFLLRTGIAYDRDLTEQTGADVWRKAWKDPPSQGHRHRHARTYNKPAKADDIDLLILCLEPRQELRFKASRERIDWSNFLGSLIHHRLFHHRPTWVVTPRRIDDPEFIAIYGQALAGLFATSFTPLRFDRSVSAPIVRRRPLDPGHVLSLDDHPSEMFVHPDTGTTFAPGTNQPLRPLPVQAMTARNDRLLASVTSSSIAQTEICDSPYAATMAQLFQRPQTARLAPKIVEPTPRGIPAPPSANRQDRIFHGDGGQLPPPPRRTFHHDYSRPLPTPSDAPAPLSGLPILAHIRPTAQTPLTAEPSGHNPAVPINLEPRHEDPFSHQSVRTVLGWRRLGLSRC
jgi:hypothetical protein